MIDWLRSNASWICPIIIAICAILTLLHLYFHKEKKDGGQSINNVSNSNVNQAGGNINNVEQGK